LTWASSVLVSAVIGTFHSLLQAVQIPIADAVESYWVTSDCVFSFDRQLLFLRFSLGFSHERKPG
jgi:hypothetical protein